MQNIFQVSSQLPVIKPDLHKILLYNILCSCVGYRYNDNCTFLNIRERNSHTLKLKKKLVSRSDEQLKIIQIESLTTPVLKCELLSRNLSTSHRVKLDLVNMLKEYLREH